MNNYIKYFNNYLKKYIYPYEAAPVTKLNQIKNDDLLLLLNSKSKKKEIFYIIRRSPGAGLFSNLIYVLNHIKLAEDLGYKPIVDMENFPTIYNEEQKVNKSKNAWNYYFHNKHKFNLKKILKENKFVLTSNRFSKSFSHTVDTNQFRLLFKKYFKLNIEHHKFAENFRKRFFTNKKVLAIHLRGTSYKTSANHPFPTTKKQTINIIRDLMHIYKFDKIFLCTEDLEYFNLIIKHFKDKVIFLNNTYKSFKDDAFEVYPRKLHRFKLGRDILLEALLISKCHSFAFTNSNVSEFIKFLDDKKKINYFLIQNGYNNSNAYIAKWLWFYKNVFPPSLGGFKDTAYVKKS